MIFKNKNKISSVLAFAFCASAFASGEGRNGPDTSGVSIPIAEDRTFDVAELSNACVKCSVQLAQNIYQQLFRRSADEISDDATLIELKSAPQTTRSPRPQGENVQEVLHVAFNGRWKNKAGSTFTVHIHPFGDRVTSNEFDNDAGLIVSADFVDGDVAGISGVRNFVLAKGIAHYAFLQKITDLKYNDYGDIESYKEKATQLYVVPASENGIVSLLQTTDTYSKYAPVRYTPTKITVDTVEYSNCLLSELQH